MGAGTWLALSVLLWLLVIWCHWRIIQKAGVNRWLILLFVVPQIATIGWIVLALIDWPHKPPNGGARVKVYGRR
jgi:hypothetical protein